MDTIDQVTQWIKWKAFFYMKSSEDNTKETYPLKTLNFTPQLLRNFLVKLCWEKMPVSRYDKKVINGSRKYVDEERKVFT